MRILLLLLGLLLAISLASPILIVVSLAFSPPEGDYFLIPFSRLIMYLPNTLIMALVSGFFISFIGIICAWLITCFDFPLRRFFAVALLLPFAFPPFLTAIAYVDLLEYSGPIFIWLRDTFAIESDFDIRTTTGAIFIYTVSLYPYAYIMARAALALKLGNQLAASRIFLKGRFSDFKSLKRIVLPVALPGLVAGTSLAMMEITADYGVASYLGIKTLTVGIFEVWLLQNQINPAAKLVIILLVIAVFLVTLESISRKRLSLEKASEEAIAPQRRPLKINEFLLAISFLAIVFFLGFLLPVFYFINLKNLATLEVSDFVKLLELLKNSTLIAVTIVFVSVLLAGAAHIISKNSKLSRFLVNFTTFGYAIPGLVFGFGSLLLFAAIDQFLNEKYSFHIFIGTIIPLVIAFTARYFKISYNGMRRVLASIPENLKNSTKIFGGSMLIVFTPLVARPLAISFCLLFMEVIKELPISLILRPAGFDTLAVAVFSMVKDERLSEAVAPAILLLVLGLIAALVSNISPKANRKK